MAHALCARGAACGGEGRVRARSFWTRAGSSRSPASCCTRPGGRCRPPSCTCAASGPPWRRARSCGRANPRPVQVQAQYCRPSFSGRLLSQPALLTQAHWHWCRAARGRLRHAVRCVQRSVSLPAQAGRPAQEVSAAAGTFSVTDDGPVMQRVCALLAAAAGRTMLEAHVKAQLGFSGVARPPAQG